MTRQSRGSFFTLVYLVTPLPTYLITSTTQPSPSHPPPARKTTHPSAPRETHTRTKTSPPCSRCWLLFTLLAPPLACVALTCKPTLENLRTGARGELFALGEDVGAPRFGRVLLQRGVVPGDDLRGEERWAGDPVEWFGELDWVQGSCGHGGGGLEGCADDGEEECERTHLGVFGG